MFGWKKQISNDLSDFRESISSALSRVTIQFNSMQLALDRLQQTSDTLATHSSTIDDVTRLAEQLNRLQQTGDTLVARTSTTDDVARLVEQLNYLQQNLIEVANQQKQFFSELYHQREELEHINELVRRNISDTNRGFWGMDWDKHTKFGGVHDVYDDEFYRNNQYGSVTSGVHVLRRFMKALNIKSVVDFGCGTGTWLYAAKTLNAKKVLGFDGDYVNRKFLLISESEFRSCNLEHPISVEEKFDLAISVEVAEHLQKSAADTFISSICCAANLVLFSAAHVGQGGDNHLNEQPLSYWQKKFEQNGYRHIEIRPFYQGDWEIESWYRENIGLYVKKEQYSEVYEKLMQHV